MRDTDTRLQLRSPARTNFSIWVYPPASGWIRSWLMIKGCLANLAKDVELDAVGRQFEPYLTAGCTTAAPLWCGLGCLLKSRGY